MSKKTEYKIFISWSGEHGKTIAKKLKQGIENDIFPGKVKCFVSDMNITCGEDWKNKINNVLKGAQFGIVCVTKDTVRSPWIHYEAGALAGNDILTIPLLSIVVKRQYKEPRYKTSNVSSFMTMTNPVTDSGLAMVYSSMIG